MRYPLRNDYDTAVRNIDKFLLDDVLKVGKPMMSTHNPNFLLSYNGGKAIVYKIKTNQTNYALKCWVEDLGDLKIRYKEIDNYLKKVQLPYFVDFAYKEQGIVVNGQKFPIIRMEWIDGIGFKNFIANNIKNPIHIRNLADKFLEMVKVLHQNDISHGDLQHGNILIRKNGDICLIDYDGLYVPQLNQEKDNIKGLPGYQHSQRNKLVKLSPKTDYFSELIIYLSLLAISEKPSYWQNIELEERLLFYDKDLEKPHSSKIFKELKQLSDEVKYLTLELEKLCQESDIEKLPPLENLVSAYTGTKIPWEFPPNAIPKLPPKQQNTRTIPIIDLENPDWDILEKPKNQPTKVAVGNSDPWSKLDTNSSNPWDKFDSKKVNNQNQWDKIRKPAQKEDKEKFTDNTNENIWNIFDKMWDKLLKSASSAWNRIMKWFN
jgi:serine/threonine protein kinase